MFQLHINSNNTMFRKQSKFRICEYMIVIRKMIGLKLAIRLDNTLFKN